MGLERMIQTTDEDTFECSEEVYDAGIQRWFGLFYNNQTEKFISFFDKLITLEDRQALEFPADI